MRQLEICVVHLFFFTIPSFIFHEKECWNLNEKQKTEKSEYSILKVFKTQL